MGILLVRMAGDSYYDCSRIGFYMIIYSALFGKYEELKEPKVITPGWRYVLFTDQEVKSNIWEIIKVEAEDPRRKARELKILTPDFIQKEDNIWIDASFTIDCDLTDFWNKHFKLDFSAPKHPWRIDVFQEIYDCIISGRGEKHLLELQDKKYRGKVKPFNGIIQSGLLLRRHSEWVKELCKNWHQELSENSSRDQVAFAKVSQDIPYTAFDWNYTRGKDFIYTHHYPKRFGNQYDKMIKTV